MNMQTCKHQGRGWPVAEGKRYLEVDYRDLEEDLHLVAEWVVLYPRVTLDILHAAATEIAKMEYPEFFLLSQDEDVSVRITSLPLADSLRDIR